MSKHSLFNELIDGIQAMQKQREDEFTLNLILTRRDGSFTASAFGNEKKMPLFRPKRT